MYDLMKLTISKTSLLLILFGLCSFMSCSLGGVKETDTLEQNVQQFLDHRVKFRGETLGLISLWYTGKISNWKQIASFNSDLKPNQISIGDLVQVPTEMVINDKALPAAFIRQRITRRGSKSQTVDSADTVAVDSSNVDTAGVVDVAQDAQAIETDPVASSDTSEVEDSGADDAAVSEKAIEDDTERERLLKELLSQ